MLKNIKVIGISDITYYGEEYIMYEDTYYPSAYFSNNYKIIKDVSLKILLIQNLNKCLSVIAHCTEGFV